MLGFCTTIYYWDSLDCCATVEPCSCSFVARHILGILRLELMKVKVSINHDAMHFMVTKKKSFAGIPKITHVIVREMHL